jgi:hypothetical protein
MLVWFKNFLKIQKDEPIQIQFFPHRYFFDKFGSGDADIKILSDYDIGRLQMTLSRYPISYYAPATK